MFLKQKKRYVVRTCGDPVLGEKARPVMAVTPEIRALAERMTEAVQVYNGIGLAAPQVGESLRLVVFDLPEKALSPNPTPGELLLLPRMPFVAVNPEIILSSDELSCQEEGCLSVPEIFAPVVRPARVVFRASTLDGEVIQCETGGLLARCIQHELDHLDGKLFIDRLDDEEAQKIEAELKQLKRYGAHHNYQRVKVK